MAAWHGYCKFRDYRLFVTVCSKRRKNEKRVQSQVVLSPSLWRFAIAKPYLTVYIANAYCGWGWNQNISSIVVYSTVL